MPQEMNPLQRTRELLEERVDLLARLHASPRDERRYGCAVPADDDVERIAIRTISLFGEACALDQLVRDALKR